MQTEKYNVIEKILRVAVFLTFVGHGLMAFQGEVSWLVYLQTVGFSVEVSKSLITYIGILDILVAIIVLVKPNKYVVLWCAIWAFLTAIIRPIAGEHILAFIERGANWGAPLALYYFLRKNKN